MFTPQNPPHTPAAANSRIATVIVALVALVAIGVTVLLIALTGAHSSTGAYAAPRSATPRTSAPVVGGDRAGHAVLDPLTGQMHG